MTWLTAQLAQIVSAFLGTRTTLKILKSATLSEHAHLRSADLTQMAAGALSMLTGNSLLSFSAHKSGSPKEALEFWIVFALLVIVEWYAEWIVRWVPMYYYAKAAFYIALAVPETKFAHFLFTDIIVPQIDRWHGSVEQLCHAHTMSYAVTYVSKMPHPFVLCLSAFAFAALLLWPPVSLDHRHHHLRHHYHYPLSESTSSHADCGTVEDDVKLRKTARRLSMLSSKLKHEVTDAADQSETHRLDEIGSNRNHGDHDGAAFSIGSPPQRKSVVTSFASDNTVS